ncbi:UNVERIFIED_CONTAM: putative B3 domain-containing protein [Sesamum indicum]
MVTGTIRIPSIAKFVQQNFDSSEALAKHLTPRPSFFKILIVDFTRRLRVPPVFSQRYGSALGGSVRLRNSSGKIWFVKLEQMDEDERYCFTQGWNKFAEEVGLEVGEFLVFRFVGESMFDVSVYGVHGCDREIPGAGFQVEDFDPDEQVELREDVPNVIKKKQSRAGNARTSESDHSQEEKSPLYFEILLKFHHRSRVSPPKKFWMAAGLSVRRTVGVVYLPKHHYQIVKLDHRPKYRIDITSGWSEFRKANGLVFGKTYSFEFKPSRNVIEVQELKT